VVLWNVTPYSLVDESIISIHDLKKPHILGGSDLHGDCLSVFCGLSVIMLAAFCGLSVIMLAAFCGLSVIMLAAFCLSET